jgi:diguanylate cyclase (GGDEF)-like protein
MYLRLLMERFMSYSLDLEKYNSCTCVMSVEVFPDGKYGNIRIKDGNTAHRMAVQRETGHDFIPDTPYEKSFPKDLNFEDYCYRCAIEQRQLHTYVSLYNLGLWLEMYMQPLISDEENIGYCIYSYNVKPYLNASSMSDLSPETSAAVLSTCIKLYGNTDFNNALKSALYDILEICGACRCCVIQLDHSEKICNLLGDAYLPGFPSFLRTMEIKKEFYKLACTFESTLAGSTCLILKNEQDMLWLKEKNPDWYKSLKQYNVESMVLFPLRFNRKVVGYIWASNFNVDNTAKIKEVLELTTFFMASTIVNHDLVKKLEFMSNMDVLTGTYNRNAMNNRVLAYDSDDAEKEKGLGIVFVDVNSLKSINDMKGHTEGDKLLVKAAGMIKDIFDGREIYRAGGDEFMVISVNPVKEDFEAKLKRLREMEEKDEDVSFAIGAYFEEKNADIRYCMRRADELMYEDKKNYYEKYPDRRYR